MLRRTHTSQKLRAAVITAIGETRRPLTAHGIEYWISHSDSGLHGEVSVKSYDCVRIVLALTPDDSIMQFKSGRFFTGIDERSAFYGLPDAAYDTGVWTPVRKAQRAGHRKKPSTARPPGGDDSSFGDERAPLPAPALVAAPPGPPVRLLEGVTDCECTQAWSTLTSSIPPNDDFWFAFITAINQLKAGLEPWQYHGPLVQEIMDAHQCLAQRGVIDDVITILSREVEPRREALFCDIFADDIF